MQAPAAVDAGAMGYGAVVADDAGAVGYGAVVDAGAVDDGAVDGAVDAGAMGYGVDAGDGSMGYDADAGATTGADAGHCACAYAYASLT
eukprot:SAG11_NODE_17412_length_519_cov_1.300000_1_plen_88_part_01